MTLIALIAATLAGLLHVFIFLLESFRWQEDNTRRVFGTTPDYEGVHNMFVERGRFFNESETARAAPVAVIGPEIRSV